MKDLGIKKRNLNFLNLITEQVLKLNFLNTVPTEKSYETAKPFINR